tara:strand:+ start:87 stop:305 length:219 start_codon:yes stop_codon:yes gene_type:complete
MITKEKLRKKKNAEMSKIERKMEKIENQLLDPKLPRFSTKEKRLTKLYEKLNDQISYIQFLKYKSIEQRLKK